MTRDAKLGPRSIRWAGIAGAWASGIALGAFGMLAASGSSTIRAEDHKNKRPDQAAILRAKAPIAEIMHCPLAFAGVHLLKELPEVSQVAYHFCKPLNEDVNQCVLYDGKGPNARLIGIEYLVSDSIYQKMPAEEKIYWHDHKNEVDAGLLHSLIETGEEERATLAKVRTLWGKVYHTWVTGSTYPIGPARLFWAVTGEEPYVLSPRATLPEELRRKPTR